MITQVTYITGHFERIVEGVQVSVDLPRGSPMVFPE
jgi:hypothetical protein